MTRLAIQLCLALTTTLAATGCSPKNASVATQNVDTPPISAECPYETIDKSELPSNSDGSHVVTAHPIPGAVEPPPKPAVWHWVNVASSMPPTLDTAPSHLSDLLVFLAQNGIDGGACGSSLGYSISVRSDQALDAIDKINVELTRNPSRWARIEFNNREDIQLNTLDSRD